MKKSLLAAISPCPNDTYIFGAWVLGMVGDLPGIRTRFVWEDVQTLNEMAESGGADIIKV
ncbi:MAG: ABC transporter substrate-binding protein, partial [Desulfovibrionales bacterium]|nr:ABC transporter substrate-binding protein [Desulfovibrionales bacterium]